MGNTDKGIRLESFSESKEDKEVLNIYSVLLIHQDGTREEFLADHMRYRSYGVELHLIEQDGDRVDKNIIISLGSDYLIERLQKETIKIKVEAQEARGKTVCSRKTDFYHTALH